MAKMYPKNLSLYQHTYSEAKVFNALKEQLDDRISVFFSISWIANVNGLKEQSECDFLIFDPMYGFLTCEVKGGKGLKVENDEWYLIDNNEERKLKRSPMRQAEESSRYFYELYSKEFMFDFKGVYGSISIFPNFVINDPILMDNRPDELVLDLSDMDNLAQCITKAFIFWKRKHSTIGFTQDQKKNFLSLIQKRIAISAAAGALIEDKEKEIDTINRVQDNYVYLLKNYKQAFISGGAGTGKTWIALKFAKKELEEGKDILITCYNPGLIKFFSEHLKEYSKAKIATIPQLFEEDGIEDKELSSDKIYEYYESNTFKKYDTIIVDEAQDCDFYIAMVIRMHLKKDEDSIYVFYDMTQNIHNLDFKEGFLINNKSFCLQENLRNTASIYSWAQKNTNLGMDVITNQIVGPTPTQVKFNDFYNMKNELENKLIELIVKEYVDSKFITILSDDVLYNDLLKKKIAKWTLVNRNPISPYEIQFHKVEDFKGLESNVIFYLHSQDSSDVIDYVAYTRAKYYLYEYILK